MAKLYYSPTSCGAASFISAFVGGTRLQLEQVDIQKHQTASGADFYTINPKGNVPALVLENGLVLNENAAVLQWIADHAQNNIGGGPAGSNERYWLQNMLNFISSELHPSAGALFAKGEGDVLKHQQSKLQNTMNKFENLFIKPLEASGRHFLVGNSFSVADAYAAVVLSWFSYLGVDLSQWPKSKAYFDYIFNLDPVKAAQAKMNEKPNQI
jgi:glutathione S-transferase